MQAVMAGILAAALAGNQFGFDLYKELGTVEEGNLLVSPASVSTALAMTYAGARGETQDQMAAVLHFDTDMPEDELASNEGELLAALQYHDEEDGYGLTIANRLWVQQDFALVPAFVQLTADVYKAELGQVDFADHTEEARQQINDWVAEQTADKIENLFPQGSLDSLTRLVLVNTVYFRDAWLHQFEPEDTTEGDFHVSAEETVQAQLMYQQERFSYAESDEVQILSMPYATNRNYSLWVLLPKEAGGLATLEEEFTAEQFTQWNDALRMEQVQVTLPKFRIESEFTLNDYLAALGMPLAFDPDEADFTGISTEEELYITQVRHKTFIEVSEWGTEAAAATGVAFGVRSAAPAEPKVFKADHPFAFAIVERQTGTVLFLGRLVNPAE